jgi:hypothetical protein
LRFLSQVDSADRRYVAILSFAAKYLASAQAEDAAYVERQDYRADCQHPDGWAYHPEVEGVDECGGLGGREAAGAKRLQQVGSEQPIVKRFLGVVPVDGTAGAESPQWIVDALRGAEAPLFHVALSA